MTQEISRVLCVIPARGGSKGIPLKNIADLAGQPLLHYALTAALRARSLTRVVVSSDHPEILHVARRYGTDIPLERPAAIAQDDTPSLPVVVHALEQCEHSGDEPYEYAMLLQTTMPLVTPEDIDQTVQRLTTTGCDSCVTVVPVGHLHPAKLKLLDGDRLHPYLEEETTYTRQFLPQVYVRNGSCYGVRRSVVLGGSLYGQDVRAVVVSKERFVQIDEPIDWQFAEFLLARTQGDVLPEASTRSAVDEQVTRRIGE